MASVPVTRKKRLLLSSYLAAVAALFAASALHPRGLRKDERMAGDVKRAKEENRELAAEVARLRREARALSGEPAALERAAREELGYVRPGEIVLQLGETGRRP